MLTLQSDQVVEAIRLLAKGNLQEARNLVTVCAAAEKLMPGVDVVHRFIAAQKDGSDVPSVTGYLLFARMYDEVEHLERLADAALGNCLKGCAVRSMAITSQLTGSGRVQYRADLYRQVQERLEQEGFLPCKECRYNMFKSAFLGQLLRAFPNKDASPEEKATAAWLLREAATSILGYYGMTQSESEGEEG
jgi:hypothetical protein